MMRSRVTVIATGFDKAPEELPKMAAPAAAQPAAPTAPEPVPLQEADVPKPEDDDDVFGDILKIFSKRDD